MIADRIETWLEAERDQLAVWVPVCLGCGIAAWFVLPDRTAWIGFIAAMLGIALIGVLFRRGSRAARVVAMAGVLAATGCGLVWARAERVASPVLAREGLAQIEATVESVEAQPARDLSRLRLRTAPGAGLPPVIRVNLADKDRPEGISPGARIQFRAWLLPPPSASLPGAYDFARVAWFQQIGATGRAIAPVTVIAPGSPVWSDLRSRLSNHVRERVGGGAGSIAATLATGDRGAISEEDGEAMRASGLAHLLSISGLHVTAVVGAAIVLVMRMLGLFPWLALRWRLPPVAAAVGAVAAVGYTLLTGAEVPTIRSCIAALLVLVALAMGREAITLRLIAAGALFVLVLWPEALAGPSFQLSFAAVASIVALHEQPQVKAWFVRREEPAWRPLFSLRE